MAFIKGHDPVRFNVASIFPHVPSPCVHHLLLGRHVYFGSRAQQCPHLCRCSLLSCHRSSCFRVASLANQCPKLLGYNSRPVCISTRSLFLTPCRALHVVSPPFSHYTVTVPNSAFRSSLNAIEAAEEGRRSMKIGST